jgi:hypothetical protein
MAQPDRNVEIAVRANPSLVFFSIAPGGSLNDVAYSAFDFGSLYSGANSIEIQLLVLVVTLRALWAVRTSH